MNAPSGSTMPDDKPSFGNLLRITLDALNMRPPDYVRSILGPIRTWLPPQNRYSEFSMLDPWRLARALNYIIDVSVPSVSGGAPPLLAMLLPPALEDLFFVRTQVLHRPDYYDDYTSYPDERWFFINGILTNGDVAQLNAACISYLFHRPVTLIQNGTDGFVRDLWECALGKEWYDNTSNTEAARIAFPSIYDSLKDPEKKKVVVICHSQGTIIMATVLHALRKMDQLAGGALPPPPPVAPEGLGVAEGKELAAAPVPIPLDESPIKLDDFKPLSGPEWAKLEIYCFATCANDMRHVGCLPGPQAVPWIEHFGNKNDLVARLGMLAPNAPERHIHLEGAHYVRDDGWGHLLDADYLLPIEKKQKDGRKRGGWGNKASPFVLKKAEPYGYTDTPRLYSYINGGPPARDGSDEEDLD